MIASVIYTLWLFNRVFQGPMAQGVSCREISNGAVVIIVTFVAAILWLGFYPSWFTNISTSAFEGMGTRSVLSMRSAESVILPGSRESNSTIGSSGLIFTAGNLPSSLLKGSPK
jgi:hypothetical protein